MCRKTHSFHENNFAYAANRSPNNATEVGYEGLPLSAFRRRFPFAKNGGIT